MTTPLCALILSFLMASTAFANSPCAYVESKKADLKVINDFDDYLVDSFHHRNRQLVSDINNEALQTYAFVRHALTLKNKDIASLAKRLKAGEKIAKGKNVQKLMEAKIMRALPPYMSRSWFYQENYKDGKQVLGPMFTWPEDTIRKVAADEIPTAFRATSIRRIKAAGKGFAPVINNPQIESGVTINADTLELADPKLGLRPWEIAIYGSLKTKDAATQYPAIQSNNNQSRPDTFYLEYTTTIYVLDISNGNLRYVNSPLSEYHSLTGQNQGAARIVSDTRMQRISLEREVSACN